MLAHTKGELIMELSRCSICGEYLGEYDIHTEYYKYLSNDEKMKNLTGFICNKCAIKHSRTEKLYHVSFFDYDVVDIFYPRVPNNRHKEEDGGIDRICLSDSLEGCLTAVPGGGMYLEDEFGEDGFSLIRVYEFDIQNINLNNIIPPEYLYQKDLVRDANISREHWVINQELIPSRTYLIKLETYDEGYPDDIRYDDYIQGMMAEEEGRRDFNWNDVINGHFTEIQNLKYEKKNM